MQSYRPYVASETHWVVLHFLDKIAQAASAGFGAVRFKLNEIFFVRS